MASSCERVRELAPELALGIADAEDRGWALEHLTRCPECRRGVEELSEVADGLLLLAPRREAPVGFEERALAPLRTEPAKRRRRLRLVLAPAAAAAAAAAIALAIVSPDLRLASQYRHTLDEANGKEFGSYELRTPAGDRAGTVFSYAGTPSWLLINVAPGQRSGLRGAELVMDDGSRQNLGWFRLDPSGSSGGGVPADPDKVAVVRLEAEGRQALVARFND